MSVFVSDIACSWQAQRSMSGVRRRWLVSIATEGRSIWERECVKDTVLLWVEARMGNRKGESYCVAQRAWGGLWPT